MVEGPQPQDLLGPEAEEVALVNLVDSLIAQLIDILDILPADLQFNENLPIFKQDGTVEKWALAMHTLKILLDASPSPR